MYLTQQEADYLMELEKRFESDKPIVLGEMSLRHSHPLVSVDGRERLYLDVWHGILNLKKYKLQERGRLCVILVRVDVGGSPHMNPDHEVIPCPHIHIYKSGFDDKWAYPLQDYPFSHSNDIVAVFEDLMHFCHIIEYPPVQRSLA